MFIVGKTLQQKEPIERMHLQTIDYYYYGNMIHFVHSWKFFEKKKDWRNTSTIDDSDCKK